MLAIYLMQGRINLAFFDQRAEKDTPGRLAVQSPGTLYLGVPGRRRIRRRKQSVAHAGAAVSSLVSLLRGGPTMRLVIAVAGIALLVVAAVFLPCLLQAGEVTPASGYSLLSPIRSGNLTVFPVVAGKSFDTAEFLTLDEGLRSGDVVVTEAGQARGLIRHRPGEPAIIHPVRGAEVNRLVLVNNSKRPLLLLAGEIVTGGKQDRVIGKDRIVPAESDPVDLSVFGVEPGRWVAANGKNDFGSAAGGVAIGLLAAPVVRSKAMGAKDQQQVWDSVRSSQSAMAVTVEATAGAASEVNATTSYARVMDNKEVQKQVDAVAEPVQRNYESVIRQLRDKNAVGVVVAVNGEIVWADIFASTQLLQKYWPKLIRSYATEAVVTRAKGGEASLKDAQKFLDNLQGRHETADTEPGIYRQTEITGDGFKVFELTSLLPKTGFQLHVAKMAE
jgi:sulfur carrier protein ThiS